MADKKSEYMEYSRNGVRKGVKAAAIVILIISFIFLLWYGAIIFVCGEVRVNNAVDIDDENREEIAGVIEHAKYKDTGSDYDSIPDIADAVRVEHLALMHKQEVTFFYKDGSDFRIFIRDWNTPLVSYIDENGYNLYYSNRDSEFSGHIVRLVIPFIVFCGSVAALIVIKNKQPAAPDGGDEEQISIE